MTHFPIFLSAIFVLRNQSKNLEKLLCEATSCIAPMVNDYELIIVDNASEDESILKLKKMTEESGLPNLQVYALTKEVDIDTASWAGVENSLGDFLVVIDLLSDDISFLPEMLERAVNGADIVLAYNIQQSSQSLLYKYIRSGFNWLYKFFNGIRFDREMPQYRVFSKQVVNFLLRHPQPAITYRHLTMTAGFIRETLTYSFIPEISRKKMLMDGIDRGIWLLASTTKAPMRIVTMLCLFGAIANLIYFVYVIAVGLIKIDITPGWMSLSLQQSGMFFLISVVLFVLGEYILLMARLSNEGPPYHVGTEFTSARLSRREKLNIEDVVASPAISSDINYHEFN